MERIIDKINVDSRRLFTETLETVTCANSIYGVTMQESGVSKQVSVRFEDVSEDGQIRIPPQTADVPPAEERPDGDDDGTQAA